MQLTKAVADVSADYISAILNWVCPECGGCMGGRENEFKCHGRCGRDWRSVWESALVRPKRTGAGKNCQNLGRSLPAATGLSAKSYRDYSLRVNGSMPQLRLYSGTLDSKRSGQGSGRLRERPGVARIANEGQPNHERT